jgi:transcriptional regulator with XRE-family HTH domain
MKTPLKQPITPAQSRDARRSLGLSQSQVIQQSKLPGHKLKNFETGSYQPDLNFLKSLSDFYAALGVDLDDDIVPTPAENLKPGASMIRAVQRPCFFISEKVKPAVLDDCLERMHQNDERIAALLNISLKSGVLSDHHDSTVAEHQELFGAMAENYLIFRFLQGAPVVQPVDSTIPPKTHADLLGQFYAKSPVAAGTSEPVDEDDTEEEGA